jgi:tRNA pseudouridine55 synthase
MGLEGVINLDKPSGASSARLVAKVKRLLPKGVKIGHAGTLDPFATGVLLLLVGKATKSCEKLMGERKGYEATIKFGARTATDDPEAPEEIVEGATAPSEAAVREAAGRLVGAIRQRPPAFSAMKVGGQRAYKLARQALSTGSEVVELKERVVQVYELEVVEYAWPLARVRVECGRGTYIRAIARDLGDALGVGGYLTELRRTFVGRFHVRDAVMVERISAEGLESHLRPME